MTDSLPSIIKQYVEASLIEGFSGHEIATKIKVNHPEIFGEWRDQLAWRQLINQIEKYAKETCRVSIDHTIQLELNGIVAEIADDVPGLSRAISYPSGDGTMRYKSWVSATEDEIQADIDKDQEQIGAWNARILTKKSLISKRRQLGIPSDVSVIDWARSHKQQAS